MALKGPDANGPGIPLTVRALFKVIPQLPGDRRLVWESYDRPVAIWPFMSVGPTGSARCGSLQGSGNVVNATISRVRWGDTAEDCLMLYNVNMRVT